MDIWASLYMPKLDHFLCLFKRTHLQTPTQKVPFSVTDTWGQSFWLREFTLCLSTISQACRYRDNIIKHSNTKRLKRTRKYKSQSLKNLLLFFLVFLCPLMMWLIFLLGTFFLVFARGSTLNCRTLATQGGTARPEPCIFPFRYPGEIHCRCRQSQRDRSKSWCSVQVDEEGNHVGGKERWGNCDPRTCDHHPVCDTVGKLNRFNKIC